MRKLIVAGTLLMCWWGCRSVDDASPSSRSTFIRSYEGPLSYQAMDLAATEEGYVMLGTMEVTDTSTVTVVMKTDKGGKRIGVPVYLKSKFIGKTIKTFSNALGSGYLILGDSIQIDPIASKGGNIEVASMKLVFIDEELNELASYTVKDTIQDANPLDPRVKTDFRGNAMTITDGRVIVLGSYAADGAPIKPFILALNNDLTRQWSDLYDALDRDYINCKSIHYKDGDIVWASSVLNESGNFTDAYITIPHIKEPLSFDNFSILGEDKEKAFFVNDIQPSRAVGFGYGIIGTIGERNGSKKNMFFTRVTADGSIIKEDTLFIDAITYLDSKSPTLSTESFIDDTGDALCKSSTGGFILAGTISSTNELGKGERDILLVKVSSFGDIVWLNTIGGSGDESVSTVVETEDEGIIVFGTNTIGNYSSFFMIKTNSHGELID